MKKTNALWIGIIAFVTIISFIFGILFLQDISFQKSNFTFTVIFESVQGLNNGDNVSMLGKRIGKVSKIKFMGQKIAAELSINMAFAFQIPVDSEIEVKSEGLLGEKYVSIKPGINTGKFIVQGETVEGKREFDFSEITPGIVPLTQDIGVFARRLKATLGEEQKTNIQESLKNIESFTGRLDSLIQDLRSVVSEKEQKNIQSLIENITNSSESFKKLTAVLNTKMAEDIGKIDIILDDIHSFTKNSDSLNQIIEIMKTSAISFRNTTLKMETLLNNLESGSGTLPKLLNDSTLYNQADSLIIDARSIVKEFKNNPGKYIKAYFKYK